MSKIDTQSAVARLQQHFPIQQRQAELSQALLGLHCLILNTVVRQGYMPDERAMQDVIGEMPVRDALKQLAEKDLIVLDDDGEAMGAYPVSLEVTQHKVMISGQHDIYAMCALDAMAIAPAFRVSTQIESSCAVSGYFLLITMKNKMVISSDHPDIRVGVQWQDPEEGCAASSMCREMVFLRDDEMAEQWSKNKQASVFTLQQAADFGAEFFTPLLSSCP